LNFLDVFKKTVLTYQIWWKSI